MRFDPSGHGTRVTSEDVAKGYFDAATRAARKTARVQRRGGRLVERKLIKPAVAEADEALRARIAQAETAGDRLSRQAAVRIGLGTGLGISGGMTAGYGAKRVIDPDRRRRSKAQFTLAKSDPDYPYLLSTIREDMVGIPKSRRNPISPVQLLSASNMIGGGVADIRSHNPFFRRRRTIRGTQQMTFGGQMLERGVGEPL